MADEEPEDPFAPRKDGMNRRAFVKTAVAAAAVGAVGATGAGLVVPLSTAGGLKIRRFPYLGARRVDGPAPQGVPLIPIKINDAGEIEGVPELEEPPSGIEHSLEWYRYCGHDQSPAFQKGHTDDNVLRYFSNPAKVAKAAVDLGAPLWYANKLGQKVVADDFKDQPPGTGAPFRWRSEDLEGNDIVTGIIIKVDTGQMRGEDAKAFMAGDLVAFSSYCAHFCCVPGFKESKEAVAADWFDNMYCTCHNSVYDPLQIRKYKFPPNL
jgi:Rieske Fe-S protein